MPPVNRRWGCWEVARCAPPDTPLPQTHPSLDTPLVKFSDMDMGHGYVYMWELPLRVIESPLCPQMRQGCVLRAALVTLEFIKRNECQRLKYKNQKLFVSRTVSGASARPVLSLILSTSHHRRTLTGLVDSWCWICALRTRRLLICPKGRDSAEGSPAATVRGADPGAKGTFHT